MYVVMSVSIHLRYLMSTLYRNFLPLSPTSSPTGRCRTKIGGKFRVLLFYRTRQPNMNGKVDTTNEPTRRTEPKPTNRRLLPLSNERTKACHINIPRVNTDTISNYPKTYVVVVEHEDIRHKQETNCNPFFEKVCKV